MLFSGYSFLSAYQKYIKKYVETKIRKWVLGGIDIKSLPEVSVNISLCPILFCGGNYYNKFIMGIWISGIGIFDVGDVLVSGNNYGVDFSKM